MIATCEHDDGSRDTEPESFLAMDLRGRLGAGANLAKGSRMIRERMDAHAARRLADAHEREVCLA